MTNPDPLRKTYRFQLRPSKRQVALLEKSLGVGCELYNDALHERRDAWKVAQHSVSYFDETKELTEIRKFDEDLADLPIDLAREPLRRVDRAFQGFFRPCRAGQKGGYPRFRSRDRYNFLSLSTPAFRVEGQTLAISKLGGFRMRMHRE